MFTTHSEAAFGWSVTKAAQRPLDVAHDGAWRWNRPRNGRDLPGLSTADPVIRCKASSEPFASSIIRDRTPVYQRFPDSLSPARPWLGNFSLRDQEAPAAPPPRRPRLRPRPGGAALGSTAPSLTFQGVPPILLVVVFATSSNWHPGHLAASA